MSGCTISKYQEYYLDALNGSDLNDGSSLDNAWQTLDFALTELSVKSQNYRGFIGLKIAAGNYEFTNRNLDNFERVALIGIDNKNANINTSTSLPIYGFFGNLENLVFNFNGVQSESNDFSILIYNSRIVIDNCVINGEVGIINTTLSLGDSNSIDSDEFNTKMADKFNICLLHGSFLFIGTKTPTFNGADNASTGGRSIIVGTDISEQINNAGVLITNIRLNNGTSNEPIPNDVWIGYYSQINNIVEIPDDPIPNTIPSILY